MRRRKPVQEAPDPPPDGKIWIGNKWVDADKWQARSARIMAWFDSRPREKRDRINETNVPE